MSCLMVTPINDWQIDGLLQEKRNSIAGALESFWH